MQPDPSSGAPLLRVLFADNARTDYGLLVRFIERGGYKLQPARVETAAQMHEALSGGVWDAVICELDLPALSHIQALALVRDAGLDIPFIVVSNAAVDDAAVEAVIAGADDCVAKSRLARLLPALERATAAAAKRRQARAELERLRALQSGLDQAGDLKAIACDLHHTCDELLDEVGAGIRWFAATTTDAAAGAQARHMQQAFEHARTRAARSTGALRPALVELGIVQALGALAQRMLRQHGIACELTANRSAIALDETSFFAMYHVCRETLRLAARRNLATPVPPVHIDVFAEAAAVKLAVAGDGIVGAGEHFAQEAWRELRDAVTALGGHLALDSAAQAGSRVSLWLPLTRAA